MRVLCLRFPEQPEPSWVEAFLKFTPLASLSTGGIFLEVSSTQHLFGGELMLLALVSSVAERLCGHEVTGAIAHQPATAQALAVHRPGTIVPLDGGDAKSLATLPLEALRDLEGLISWSSSRLDHIIDFFRSVGVATLGQMQAFDQNVLHERWGDMGTTLWKRLHSVDEQLISPWLTREPLAGYAYFEDPAGQLNVLSLKLDPLLQHLFFRLEGLGRFARSLKIILHCEWSGLRHELRVEPIRASRDLKLFQDLLWKRLESIDFLNPIKELELQIEDVPEQIQQLDFFEPRDNHRSRWERLISFAAQGDIEMGFLQPVAEHFAEKSVVFKPAEPTSFQVKDVVEKQGDSVQVKPSYAKALTSAPRPSLLLNPPREIEAREAATLRRLTAIPSERILGPWWKPQPQEGRDYYYALSQEGRLLWLYRDKETRKMFLQGAFD